MARQAFGGLKFKERKSSWSASQVFEESQERFSRKLLNVRCVLLILSNGAGRVSNEIGP